MRAFLPALTLKVELWLDVDVTKGGLRTQGHDVCRPNSLTVRRGDAVARAVNVNPTQNQNGFTTATKQLRSHCVIVPTITLPILSTFEAVFINSVGMLCFHCYAGFSTHIGSSGRDCVRSLRLIGGSHSA